MPEHKDSERGLIGRIEGLEAKLLDMDGFIERRVGDAISQRLFKPYLPAWNPGRVGEFMPFSTCSAADFLHPRYAEICQMLNLTPVLHRKVWEWVFVTHKLIESGVVGKGKRGVVFGVGREKLPALFASMGAEIVATDAPPSIGAGWSGSSQHSSSLDQLRFPDIVQDEIFDRSVTHRYADMNAIDDDLNGFDFTWSSCCFEHLGSLEAGIQFVINSVEKTLKVGGVACHTTEFNLTSDDSTVEEGDTVIYRRKDIQNLVYRLRSRGHHVEPFIIAPDSHFLDFHVDAPPYTHDPHLKLKLGNFVVTSVGIVVRKG